MTRYTIRKVESFKIYESPLFTVYAYRKNSMNPMVVFSNGVDAAGVFVERSQVADLLKRKFKNHVDRRRQIA